MTRLKQISEQVVARFGAAHRTLGTAESLTGGMIASSVAGGERGERGAHGAVWSAMTPA